MWLKENNIEVISVSLTPELAFLRCSYTVSLGSIVKINKYVHEQQEDFNCVSLTNWHHAWCIAAVLHNPCEHTINMTMSVSWGSWKSPAALLIDCITWGISHRGWARWTFICILLAACHSRVMVDPEASQTHQEALVSDTSWQLSIAWRLLCYGWAAHVFSEGWKKQEITLFDTITVEILADLAWQDTVLSLTFHSCSYVN